MTHLFLTRHFKTKKTAKILCILAILFLVSVSIDAENIGVYGQVYTIAEPDLLTFIHERLLQFKADGRLQAMENDFQKRVVKHIIRPIPVSGIRNASKNSKDKVFYYTPTFTLPENIYDSSGKLLFSAGTTINPLNQVMVKKVVPNAVIPQFNETLIFINADKQSQISFAQQEIKSIHGVYKIILIKGNLKTASDQLGRIYFDQAGRLCNLFHITRVPAILTRDGARLKIKEQNA